METYISMEIEERNSSLLRSSKCRCFSKLNKLEHVGRSQWLHPSVYELYCRCAWLVASTCLKILDLAQIIANMKVEGWKARMTRFVEFDPRILSVWVGIWHSQVWPKAIVVDEHTLQTPDLLGGLWFKGQREKVWKIGRWSSHRSAPKKIRIKWLTLKDDHWNVS